MGPSASTATPATPATPDMSTQQHQLSRPIVIPPTPNYGFGAGMNGSAPPTAFGSGESTANHEEFPVTAGTEASGRAISSPLASVGALGGDDGKLGLGLQAQPGLPEIPPPPPSSTEQVAPSLETTDTVPPPHEVLASENHGSAVIEEDVDIVAAQQAGPTAVVDNPFKVPALPRRLVAGNAPPAQPPLGPPPKPEQLKADLPLPQPPPPQQRSNELAEAPESAAMAAVKQE
eukprot:UC1_evm1s875